MRHHFIREKINIEEIEINRINIKKNLADIFIKCLFRPRFKELIQKMNMRTA